MDVIEISFWIALAGLVAALTIDFINMTMLIRLRRWSQGAVEEIISEATSELMRRINLQVGKSGSTIDKLTEKFSESLQNANEEVPDSMKQLNLPLLFAKIQSGNLDFKDFIPIAAKLLQSGNNGNGSGNNGKWKD